MLGLIIKASFFPLLDDLLDYFYMITVDFPTHHLQVFGLCFTVNKFELFKVPQIVIVQVSKIDGFKAVCLYDPLLVFLPELLDE